MLQALQESWKGPKLLGQVLLGLQVGCRMGEAQQVGLQVLLGL